MKNPGSESPEPGSRQLTDGGQCLLRVAMS